MVGRTLAHYEILEKIGSGGMGDVYLAKDTKLDRNVALKVLPPELAENEERRERFRREAKAIAALNHPNIVTLYSVEHADGIHFITMELVKGKPLAKMIPRSGFALDRFFELAIPFSDAVAAAHDQGITHRDLKPENVMSSDTGRVKVLDFGLAKVAAGAVELGTESDVPTSHRTEQGKILGTLRYLSPEQAEGKSVDARSDIFSMGVLFYEMLTGEQPFRADTPAATISAILKDTPRSVTALKPSIPRDIAKLVKRCLAKDPERRFQSAKDIRNELEELKQDVESGELEVTSSTTHPSRWRTAAMALALLAGGIVAYRWLVPGDETLQFENPVQLTSDIGLENYPTWSPEGGRLAYHANTGGRFDIWVAQVQGGPSVNLTDHLAADATYPRWSPDGSQIAFWSAHDGYGCYVMSALGGEPRKVVATVLPMMAPPAWSADSARLACSSRRDNELAVDIVSLSSREVEALTVPGQYAQVADLTWSPDERYLAYIDAINPRRSDATVLWIVRRSDGEAFAVTDGMSAAWSPSFSRDGRSLYYVSNRGGTMDLWRQGLRTDGEPRDEPQRLTVGLGMRSADFLADGTKLAYSNGRRVANVWRAPVLPDRPASWSDAEQLTFDHAYIESLDLSPDGAQIAVSSNRGGFIDVWTVSSSGGEMRAVTTDASPDWFPDWSPDGSEIAFFTLRSGNRDIWILPIDGGPARQLTTHPRADINPSWSPDGSQIAYASARDGSLDIWLVPSSGGEPRKLTDPSGQDVTTTWSPDGEWIAFASDRAGGRRILWRVPVSGGEPQPVTTNEANQAIWSRDGRSIYYLGVDDMWVISVDAGVERRLTELIGKRGNLGEFAFDTDERFLYFTWEEDLGDIWVMDVVKE